MNITQHPELLQRLAASYALGTLRGGGARRRFETLAREACRRAAAALVWQTHWSVWLIAARHGRLTLPCGCAFRTWCRPTKPSTAWSWPVPGGERVRLVAQPALVARCGGSRCAGHRGRRAGGVAGARGYRLPPAPNSGAAAAVKATPQIQYVAVLADDQAAARCSSPDPKNQKLVLQRVGGFQEGDDKSLQLWALPPAGGPRSLGFWGKTSCSPSRQPNKR